MHTNDMFISHVTGYNHETGTSQGVTHHLTGRLFGLMLARKSLNIFSHSYHTCTTNYDLNTFPANCICNTGATNTVENTAQRTTFLAAYSSITLNSNTKLNNLKLKVNVHGLTRIHMLLFYFSQATYAFVAVFRTFKCQLCLSLWHRVVQH